MFDFREEQRDGYFLENVRSIESWYVNQYGTKYTIEPWAIELCEKHGITPNACFTFFRGCQFGESSGNIYIGFPEEYKAHYVRNKYEYQLLRHFKKSSKQSVVLVYDNEKGERKTIELGSKPIEIVEGFTQGVLKKIKGGA